MRTISLFICTSGVKIAAISATLVVYPEMLCVASNSSDDHLMIDKLLHAHSTDILICNPEDTKLNLISFVRKLDLELITRLKEFNRAVVTIPQDILKETLRAEYELKRQHREASRCDNRPYLYRNPCLKGKNCDPFSRVKIYKTSRMA